jgi:hypothetical protein
VLCVSFCAKGEEDFKPSNAEIRLTPTEKRRREGGKVPLWE